MGARGGAAAGGHVVVEARQGRLANRTIAQDAPGLRSPHPYSHTVQSYRPSLSSFDGTTRRSQVHAGLTTDIPCPVHPDEGTASQPITLASESLSHAPFLCMALGRSVLIHQADFYPCPNDEDSLIPALDPLHTSAA